MLEAAPRLERASIEVAVIPENQHCGPVADIHRAQLGPGGSLLGCLGLRGRLEVWDPADRDAAPAAVDGSCSDFSWEEAPPHSQAGGSFRLLAVGSQFDLKLLEVEAERSASISLLCVCECPAERLLQAVTDQDHGVSELQALRVLSFIAGRCRLMLNSEWLLQLQWQQVEAELQILTCCNIQMIDSNTSTAVHHCLCRETLFTLSSTGLICILPSPLSETHDH